MEPLGGLVEQSQRLGFRLRGTRALGGAGAGIVQTLGWSPHYVPKTQ
jgi:hypothetical protein